MAIIDIEYGHQVYEENHPEILHKELREMEMVLQNSSYGHEYALMELQESHGVVEKEEIQNKLDDLKNAYFHARDFLVENHPNRLKELETELVEQKVRIFKSYNA